MRVLSESRESNRSILQLSLGISLGVFVISVAAVLLCGATADAATYAATMSGAPLNWTTGPWTCAGTCPNAYPGIAAGDAAQIGGSSGTMTFDVPVASPLKPV